MSFETAPPDEPVAKPPPVLRLMRSDAGIEAGEPFEDDHD
jgi:hypothetical protein